MAEATLSLAQEKIYNLLQAGKTAEDISKTLDMSLGVVNAQITRIKNKGAIKQEAPNPVNVRPQDMFKGGSERPASTGGSANDQIAMELGKGGSALTAEKLRELAESVSGKLVNEVHPMVLMGVTIQFVRLCGGRMTAHQVIEDVYAALRSFTSENGGKVPDDTPGETKPLPKSDSDRLALQEEIIADLQKQITNLRQKMGS